jgi:hypothetical protein
MADVRWQMGWAMDDGRRTMDDGNDPHMVSPHVGESSAIQMVRGGAAAGG